MTTYRTLARAGVLAALACLLSACWVSQEPLLTAKNASTIDFEGTYRSVSEEDEDDLTISAQGKRLYLMHDSEERIDARFLRLRGDWYLAQYEGKDEELAAGETFYIYQLIRVDNGRLLMYSSSCKDTPGEYKGLERSQTSCDFTRLGALKSAARAYADGVEKGSIENDPTIFAPLPGP